jgi:hypothetical protein
VPGIALKFSGKPFRILFILLILSKEPAQRSSFHLGVGQTIDFPNKIALSAFHLHFVSCFTAYR